MTSVYLLLLLLLCKCHWDNCHSPTNWPPALNLASLLSFLNSANRAIFYNEKYQYIAYMYCIHVILSIKLFIVFFCTCFVLLIVAFTSLQGQAPACLSSLNSQHLSLYWLLKFLCCLLPQALCTFTCCFLCLKTSSHISSFSHLL